MRGDCAATWVLKEPRIASVLARPQQPPYDAFLRLLANLAPDGSLVDTSLIAS